MAASRSVDSLDRMASTSCVDSLYSGSAARYGEGRGGRERGRGGEGEGEAGGGRGRMEKGEEKGREIEEEESGETYLIKGKVLYLAP